MGFTEALHRSADGFTIVSCKSIAYAPEKLQACKLGSHAATCNAVVSLAERKGEWEWRKQSSI